DLREIELLLNRDPSTNFSPTITIDPNPERFINEPALACLPPPGDDESFLKEDILEDVESKDSNVSNFDEPVLLNTPLFDEDECFDPGGEINKIDAFLDAFNDSEGDGHSFDPVHYAFHFSSLEPMAFESQMEVWEIDYDEESNHEDASDTGDAPKQQQQVIPQTTAISNIKLPILKKEEYDIWAMVWSLLEYIDNEVWKKFKLLKRKGRLRISDGHSQGAYEKHGLNLAMTMRTKPEIDTLSIDDLYNNLRVFEQEIQGASKTSSSAQNVAFVSQSNASIINGIVQQGGTHDGRRRETHLYQHQRSWEASEESDGLADKMMGIVQLGSNILQLKRQSMHLWLSAQAMSVNLKNWNAMMERELGEGYSFTKKKCFVCGSLSHLIKDCDYYEKKKAREAEVKRVVNTGTDIANITRKEPKPDKNGYGSRKSTQETGKFQPKVNIGQPTRR
ncbi:hypothetical protein Tco_0874617, partial [Tanacetum coccineum]